MSRRVNAHYLSVRFPLYRLEECAATRGSTLEDYQRLLRLLESCLHDSVVVVVVVVIVQVTGATITGATMTGAGV